MKGEEMEIWAEKTNVQIATVSLSVESTIVGFLTEFHEYCNNCISHKDFEHKQLIVMENFID